MNTHTNGQGTSNEDNHPDAHTDKQGTSNEDNHPDVHTDKQGTSNEDTDNFRVDDDPDYMYRSKLVIKHPVIGYGVRIKPEDVPMRKIYVSHFKENTNDVKLRTVFSQYGDIQEIIVVDRKNFSFAFICFVHPEDAKKAVSTRTVINGRKLEVKPAKHQSLPSPGKIDKLFAIVAPDKCYLDILNDDCLMEIFSYFHLVDRIKYEVVCHRWKNLIRKMSIPRKLDFTTDPLESLFLKKPRSTYIIFKELIKRFGSNLVELAVHDTCFCSFKEFNEICHHCKNIEILRLHKFTRFRLNVLDDFHPSSFFQYIKNFSVTNGCLGDGLARKLFDLMKNLETFTLKYSSLNFRELTPLKHLKYLTLHNTDLYFHQFEYILENSNKQLLKLDIKACRHDSIFYKSAIQAIVKCAPNLEELQLSMMLDAPIILNDIVELVNLRKLCLNSVASLSSSLLKKITRTCTLLEHVELMRNEKVPTSAYVSLGKLRKLSFLAICQCPVKSVLTDSTGLTTGLTNEGLIQLVNNLINPGLLKHLYCSYASATDEAMHCVLTICRSLETLNINNCPNITKATLVYAQEVVATRNSNIPLKIDIKGNKFGNMKLENKMSKNRLIITTDGCKSCKNL